MDVASIRQADYNSIGCYITKNGISMSELILPDSVANQLQGLSHVVHLCDASGKRIGSFVPKVDPSEWEIEPELSDEELRRIEQSSEWYSTDEVLRHLEKLD
jgi:hypothetical protein